MRVAVIGASGVAGRAFVRAASARHSLLTERVDIFDRSALTSFLRGCDAAVNLATRIGQWDMNDRIRREGTANLIAAALASNMKTIVQQSVAMLDCVADDRPQTEDDPIEGYGVLQSAYDMEMLVRAAPLDWRIVRGGYFYGPGTNFKPFEEGDDAWVSLIHVDDFAEAVLCVLERGNPREAYIASEDSPIRVRRSRIRSFRVSNAKLRALGWSPTHGTGVTSSSPRQQKGGTG